MAALRRRLTLLMAALTSLVLAGALAVTWQYAAAQFETSAEMLLSQNFSALCDRLDSAESVSDVWLRDQEHNNGLLIFLQDNGAALHFAGASGNTEARAALEPQLAEGLVILNFGITRLIPNKIRIPKPGREPLQHKDFCIKTSG